MFLRKLNKKNDMWEHAYRANAKFYTQNGNVLGVFPLTEDTDTIFQCNPFAKVDNEEVKIWKILLIPLNGDPIGSIDLYKALDYFASMKCEKKGKEILVKGISRQGLIELLQLCN